MRDCTVGLLTPGIRPYGRCQAQATFAHGELDRGKVRTTYNAPFCLLQALCFSFCRQLVMIFVKSLAKRLISTTAHTAVSASAAAIASVAP